jgi:hypothetical protein
MGVASREEESVPAFELRSIAPLRCANILAAVSFVLYGALALMIAPFLVLIFAVLPKMTPVAQQALRPQAPPPLWLPLLMVVVYPFLGAVMGWVMGALGSVTYNVVVRMTGGMVLQFDTRDPSAI